MAECVVELEDIKLPLPSSPSEEVVLHGDMSTFLIYSTYKASDDHSSKSVLVECVRPSLSRFGYPNDEGIAEHRLYQKGLSEVLGFAEVKDSALVKEYESMSGQSTRRIWSSRGIPVPNKSVPDKRHFIVSLKENVFEVLCKELQLVGIYSDHASALQEAASRINLG